MKKIMIALLIFTAINACKKNNADIVTPTVVTQVPKVKTFSNAGTNEVYTYDAQGRILSRINTSSNWKYEYTYNSNTVIENYYVGSTLSTTYQFDLNANGLITRSLLTYPATGGYQIAYTYNTNNLVAKKINSNTTNANTTTEIFFYTGNLLDSTVKTFSSNTNVYRTHFTYYTDKNNSFGFKNRGYLFYAEEEEKPVKTLTYIFSPTNTQVSNYAYTYDAAGKITNRKINGGANGDNDITYY
jgi:YD repeat-containing protein